MKRMFTAVFVILVALLATKPVFAQDGAPTGDGWDCFSFSENEPTNGLVLILEEEYPITQLWIDGVFYQTDIPEDKAACFVIEGLGTNTVRVKSLCGDIKDMCQYIAQPTPVATSTPAATATQSVTATALSTPTTMPTRTSLTDQSSVTPTLPSSAPIKSAEKPPWLIIAVILTAVIALYFVIRWYIKLRHH